MIHVNCQDERHIWYPQLLSWVETVMYVITPLGQEVPKGSARIIDRPEQVEFELQVEWIDKLMGELMFETFTHKLNK